MCWIALVPRSKLDTGDAPHPSSSGLCRLHSSIDLWSGQAALIRISSGSAVGHAADSHSSVPLTTAPRRRNSIAHNDTYIPRFPATRSASLRFLMGVVDNRRSSSPSGGAARTALGEIGSCVWPFVLSVSHLEPASMQSVRRIRMMVSEGEVAEQSGEGRRNVTRSISVVFAGCGMIPPASIRPARVATWCAFEVPRWLEVRPKDSLPVSRDTPAAIVF